LATVEDGTELLGGGVLPALGRLFEAGAHGCTVLANAKDDIKKTI